MDEILNQALEFDVPIMQEEGIKFLINFIKVWFSNWIFSNQYGFN